MRIGEGQAWQALHDAIREARTKYQAAGPILKLPLCLLPAKAKRHHEDLAPRLPTFGDRQKLYIQAGYQFSSTIEMIRIGEYRISRARGISAIRAKMRSRKR